MRDLLMGLLTTLLLATTTLAEAKYYPPLDRLVLNEVVSTAPASSYPFYLPKRGRYYAEIIREGQTDTAPQTFNLIVRVMRDTNVLFEKHVQQTLASDQSSATLFWLNSPYDVPDRHELTLTVATDTPLAAPLRLQITRKVELLPLVMH